jgi:hypothetical protein
MPVAHLEAIPADQVGVLEHTEEVLAEAEHQDKVTQELLGQPAVAAEELDPAQLHMLEL